MVTPPRAYGKFPVILAIASAFISFTQLSPGQAGGKGKFSRSYKEAETRRDVVAKAAESANTILGDGSAFVLVPSWLPRPSTEKEVIPVYSGNPIKPSIAKIASVPDNERCIIVEEKELPTLEELWGNRQDEALKQPIERLLAIALLHESGHLHLRHSGCLDQHGDRLISRIHNSIKVQNKEDHDKNRETLAKRRESDADSFVVKVLLEAKADQQNLKRWLLANNLEMTLGNVSLNLTIDRIRKNFGGEVIVTKKSSKFYSDKGMTHPNMELRILRILAGLEPQSKYPQLVEEFMRRRDAIELGILYQAPPGESKAP